jgi:hypothetical protein
VRPRRVRASCFGLDALRAIADHDEHAGHLPTYAREDAHHIAHALHLAEVGDVHDDAASRPGDVRGIGEVARPVVQRRIDEVGMTSTLQPDAAERT